MELIKFFFKVSNTMKLYHWKTGSYSRHVASGSLFGEVIDISDNFMETYFGRYGKSSVSSTDCSADLLNDTDIVLFIKEGIMFLNDIVKNGYLKGNETDLLNIRDELIAAMNKTLYLFTLQ